jgi:hypothetical protein
VLFLEKREYELVYHGKEREDILANSRSLQPIRTREQRQQNREWHNIYLVITTGNEDTRRDEEAGVIIRWLYRCSIDLY